MTKDEILNYLKVSRYKSVVVDQSLCVDYPGWVRTILIRPGFLVEIDYNPYNLDEGINPGYEAEYSSLDVLVSSLEEFLGLKIEDWENYSKTGGYPNEPENLMEILGERKSLTLLEKDMRSGTVKLPKGALFTPVGLAAYLERD